MKSDRFWDLNGLHRDNAFFPVSGDQFTVRQERRVFHLRPRKQQAVEGIVVLLRVSGSGQGVKGRNMLVCILKLP